MQRATDDAGIGALGVAKLAGFVDGFAGQADVGGGRLVPSRNMLVVGPRANLATLLRRVVFVGEPALGLALDFEGVGPSRRSRGT